MTPRRTTPDPFIGHDAWGIWLEREGRWAPSAIFANRKRAEWATRWPHFAGKSPVAYPIRFKAEPLHHVHRRNMADESQVRDLAREKYLVRTD